MGENRIRYLRALRRCLHCPRMERKQFLQEVESVAEDFAAFRPNADYEDLLAFLGTPQELANALYDTLDPKRMQRYWRYRHWLLIAIIIALSAALLCVSVLLAQRSGLL